VSYTCFFNTVISPIKVIKIECQNAAYKPDQQQQRCQCNNNDRLNTRQKFLLYTVNSLLNCAQRTQTSPGASNLNQTWSRIQIQISGLMRTRTWMSAGSLPKCCVFIILLASVISQCRKNRPVTVSVMLINYLKSREGNKEVIRNLYEGPDHHQSTS